MSFGRTSFREDPKARGAKKREATLVGGYSDIDEGWGDSGKRYLNYKGKERLRELRKRPEARKAAIEQRQRKAFARLLLSNPLSLKTSDGKRVRILRQGFFNIFKGQKSLRDRKPTPARALVLAFVDGKKIWFYRSSGTGSAKMPGEWFPTLGPDIHDRQEKPYAGHLAKMQGHPDGNAGIKPHFPEWLEEARQFLKRREKSLKLYKAWSARDYLRIEHLFREIPFTDQLKAKQDY